MTPADPETIGKGELEAMNHQQTRKEESVMLPTDKVLPTAKDVAGIRHATGLSQAKFCKLTGINPYTIRGWEQGKREPSKAARVLLSIIQKHPFILGE